MELKFAKNKGQCNAMQKRAAEQVTKYVKEDQSRAVFLVVWDHYSRGQATWIQDRWGELHARLTPDVQRRLEVIYIRRPASNKT